jgi:hypothetical protein
LPLPEAFITGLSASTIALRFPCSSL